jgi:hypothetical protein
MRGIPPDSVIFERRLPGLPVAAHPRVSFGRVTLALFVVCQAFDGLLTYFAVMAFGHAIEGNPILATWMTIVGAGPTLVVAKIGACACGLILYTHGTHRALATLTALYILMAVGPWLYLLSGL